MDREYHRVSRLSIDKSSVVSGDVVATGLGEPAEISWGSTPARGDLRQAVVSELGHERQHSTLYAGDIDIGRAVGPRYRTS